MLKHSTATEQEELFRKHRKLTRAFKEKRSEFPSLNVAVLSGVTVHPFKDILETLLLEGGFNPTLFEGDYNAYAFEARFSDELVEFNPEIVYLHTTIDNVITRPEISADVDSAKSVIDAYLNEFKASVDALLQRTDATIIVNSLEYPNFRMSGNFEAVAPGGFVRFVNEVNARLADMAQENARVVLSDVNYLSSQVGLENWRDDKSYAAFKQPFTRRAVTEVARSVTALILASKGKSGKCLVLDLDNTMWGGIIGDDGVDNVEIGPETAKGEGYQAFQSAIKPLLGRGIGFGVCSKNEEATGLAGLNRHEMVLKESDFHAVRINWNQKSENLKALKNIFNVGYDAIYFIDDSDFERSEVKFALPDLRVPDVEVNPYSYIKALSDSYAFETLSLTNEDLKRGESFRSMAALSEQTEAGGDIGGFLRSLEMKADICQVTDATQARVHQLINKTNQFNLTTLRMNEADVAKNLNSDLMLTAALKDRNTDYGLISVLWGEREGNQFTLKNWVMSCRVFNRKLEEHFFFELCDRLARDGVTSIAAEYIPSKKNKPVEKLLDKLGFDVIEEDSGRVKYATNLPQQNVADMAETKEIFA